MRPRPERFRLMLAHRAAAAALEASLKNEAADEYATDGTRVSWEWPGAGSVVASLNHDAVVITDEAAFLDWFAVDSPHQVRPRTGWEVINPKWLTETYLPGFKPQDLYEDTGTGAVVPPQPGDRRACICPDTGAIVPGVRWVKGGGLRSVSVKADSDETRRLNLAAADYAAGAGLDQLGITKGESDGRETATGAGGPGADPSGPLGAE